MNVFEGIFRIVDNTLDGYVYSTVGDLIAFLSPIFTSMLIIWIAIWGYAMMFGKVAEPLQEGVFRILRIGFIMALGLTVGTYMDVVVDVLAHGPETVAAVVTGTDGGSAQLLDQLFSRVLGLADDAWEEAGVLDGDFGMYLVGALIMVFGAAVTVIVAFLILASKIVTAGLLAVGPLFIIGLLFNATQKFFEAWLAQVMNFGMILILGSSIGRMAVDTSEAFMTLVESSTSDMTSMTSAAYLCAFFFLAGLVIKQVPAIASGLGGGVALATQGALSSAMSAMRPTTMRRQARRVSHDARLAGSAAAAPAKGAYKAGKAAHRAYQKRFGANTITGG